MAKVQTRRTISFNREVYQRIMKAAEAAGMTASHFVEQCVGEKVPLPETTHFKPRGGQVGFTPKPKRQVGRPRLTLEQRIERLKRDWGMA